MGGQEIGDDTSMNEFVLFAEPWWVNLLIAIPFVAYFLWRKRGLLSNTRTTRGRSKLTNSVSTSTLIYSMHPRHSASGAKPHQAFM